MTFAACAPAYLDAHHDTWRNALHRKQWRTTLNNYAGPVFGSLPGQEVDLTLVMKALEPICRSTPETASRLRGRIEAVLDWAIVRGYRKGENPAAGVAISTNCSRREPRSRKSSIILPSLMITRQQMQRRASEGKLCDSLATEMRELSEWPQHSYPDAPAATPKALANGLRHEYRKLK